MRKRLFWTLCGVTLAIYLVMAFWSLPLVSAGAGGLPPFDMRPSGYGYAEARMFLEVITPQASAFYRDVQQRFDLVYPALVALTLFLALVALLPRRLAPWRYALAAPALLIAVFDYFENHAIGVLLAAGPAVSPEMVATASQCTILKSASTTMVASAVLVLLLWRGGLTLRRRFNRAAGPYTAPHPHSP